MKLYNVEKVNNMLIHTYKMQKLIPINIKHTRSRPLDEKTTPPREKDVEAVDQLFVDIEIMNNIVMSGYYDPTDCKWLRDAVATVKKILEDDSVDLNDFYNIYNYRVDEVEYVKCDIQVKKSKEVLDYYRKLVGGLEKILSAEFELFSKVEPDSNN